MQIKTNNNTLKYLIQDLSRIGRLKTDHGVE